MARRIDEMGCNATLVLLDRCAAMIEHDSSGAEPILNCFDEYSMEFAAMDRELSPLITRGSTTWLAEDELPVSRKETHFARFNRNGSEGVVQAEQCQLAHGMWQ